MADIKISALPGASTLDGTETIPLVQGGTTKKVTTDQFLIKDASGNVGIGTASPACRLNIAGYSSATTAPDLLIQRTSTGVGIQSGPNITFQDDSDGTRSVSVQNTQGRFGVWNYNAGWKERLCVDNAGNLGLGVTPSAWGFGNALQVGTSTSIWNNVDTSYILLNAYFDGGNWRYRNTDYASSYRQVQGGHTWFTAPSGTAGNPISFTQAMTLDASGNLGVGTASPVEKLTVNGAIAVTGGITGHGANRATFSQEGANGAFLQSYGGDASTCGEFVFRQASSDFSVQRIAAKIDALGNLSVVGAIKLPTASSAPTWDTNTAFWQEAAFGARYDAYQHRWDIGTTRTRGMMLDSSGNLLVGTTSASGRFTVRQDSDAESPIYVVNAATSGKFASFEGNGAVRGSITWSGSTTSFNTSSDARLKENISNADNGSALIDSLQVRKFDWKSDGSHQRFGFVAQELDAVYPEAVSKPADPDEMMGVDYSKLVPLLVQEVQSLRARVAALETV